MATATDNSRIFGSLAAMLNELGLGELFTMSNGKPGGWLWQQIQAGIDTADQLSLAIEETAAFKKRYSIITEMRSRAAKGENVRVPTIGEVREYEDRAATMMRQAGLPAWFYDSYTDTQNLMRNDIALPELEQRIAQGWSTVRDADPAVRKAFSDFYGVANGDAALAAFVLDPTHTATAVERASRAAYTAGYGATQGMNISKDVAERVADLPTTTAGIQQSLGEASRMQGVTAESIGETTDLTADDLVKASALGDGRAAGAIERRVLERQAQERSNQGGALQTDAGLTGVRAV